MKKSELRKQALSARRSLDQEAKNRLNQTLLTQFSTLNFSGIKVLHVFLPIEDKVEPDTFLLISWLKENHPAIKILVPRANFETALMTHHEWTALEDLEKSTFNILEPRAENAYQGDIDLVVVPLLTFDLRGFRVGYGKGFYDRFLTNSRALKVGISFFEPVEIISDADVLDVRLDMCITPDQIYYFSS